MNKSSLNSFIYSSFSIYFSPLASPYRGYCSQLQLLVGTVVVAVVAVVVVVILQFSYNGFPIAFAQSTLSNAKTDTEFCFAKQTHIAPEIW